ncbi:hypothetical protein CEXT_564361 [Caerostris extrusa]|uniref:Uncharacterized protein n=1 Tax=Caerostris extrusa TaxID=172846 RepID=A0AAV4XDD8_CAEEX|nr:hypothetical protein CEXT_564361 [Caerostris extrusa]
MSFYVNHESMPTDLYANANTKINSDIINGTLQVQLGVPTTSFQLQYETMTPQQICHNFLSSKNEYSDFKMKVRLKKVLYIHLKKGLYD